LNPTEHEKKPAADMAAGFLFIVRNYQPRPPKPKVMPGPP
jgi:hypothetical protein